MLVTLLGLIFLMLPVVLDGSFVFKAVVVDVLILGGF